MSLSTFYARYARWICLLALAWMPFLLYGAKGAFENIHNDVLDWLPPSFDETQRLFWFVERFGSDEILVVSWEGCTLDDPRLDRMAAGLVEPQNHPQHGASFRWFREVYTGRQALEEMTSGSLQLSRDDAIARLEGWLIGRDGQTACAVALISEDGALNRLGAMQFVHEVADSVGIAPDALRVGGPTADGVAIDQASNQWMIQMVLLSALLGLAVARKSLGQWRATWIAFLTAIFAWAASLSVVHYGGDTLDAVLLMMPSLVFVLAISGSIHLTNYQADVDPAAQPKDATAVAIRRGWLPCLLASVTTAIGLGSLMASQLTPVRKFGCYASIGVLINVFALLIIWPSLTHCWPLRRRDDAREETAQARLAWWQPLFESASRHAHLWLVTVVLALPVLAWGVSQINTTAQLQDLLGPESTSIQHSRWLQQRFGALVPVEVVLRFSRTENEDPKTMLARAQLVEQLRKRLRQLSDVDSAVAATTFAPALPEAGGARQIMLRRVLATHLNKHRDRFVELGFLCEEPHEELWRISTRVPSVHVDYGQLLQRLDQDIDVFLDEQRAAGTQMTAEICGGVPLLYIAQKQLLEDLIKSFLAAFALIGVTMVLLLRGLMAGMLAMIPNVVPTLIAFGAMGLLAIPVDIGTMMTASAAMGIAVDDTLHFLVWFRRGLQQGHDRTAAVRFSFQHCATPMLQTSVICGLGLLVFLLSPFSPISRFGGVMAMLLGLALLGDLLILPALVCGRLGTCFAPKAATEPSR